MKKQFDFQQKQFDFQQKQFDFQQKQFDFQQKQAGCLFHKYRLFEFVDFLVLLNQVQV
jgi:hypothetical protein